MYLAVKLIQGFQDEPYERPLIVAINLGPSELSPLVVEENVAP